MLLQAVGPEELKERGPKLAVQDQIFLGTPPPTDAETV